MPVASRSSFGVGLSMPDTSHTVIESASADYHILCGERVFTKCDTGGMPDDTEKNGGPNHLKAWREFREMTQGELADKVGTNQNMIGYLESGERGLSAKWLRRLAPALQTTPGFILDHDPNTLPSDIVEIWVNANERERRQLIDIAKTLVRTGTGD